jgi:4-alpha-glucanotransferase
MEDLWQETTPQNVPGTSSERPNWRRKAKYTLDEIAKVPEVAAAIETVAQARGLRGTPHGYSTVNNATESRSLT